MSGVDNLIQLAATLEALGKQLGIQRTIWIEREAPDEITYTDFEFPRDTAQAFDAEDAISMISACGEALCCRFLLGEEVLLTLTPDLTQDDWTAFRKQIQLSPTLTFEFKLNKRLLAQYCFGEVARCRFFLYLFPEALEHFLQSGPDRLETVLWGVDEETKVVMIIPNREFRLNGPSLAVIGGQALGGWHRVVTSSLPDSKRLLAIYQLCQERLKWREPWLQHLTPLHLQVDGEAPKDDIILTALRAHLVNLFVLYTADRTVKRADGQWVATYAGTAQSVEVILGAPTAKLPGNGVSLAGNLVEVVKWIYDPQWAGDRLLLVQIAVAEALYTSDPSKRYSVLCQHADGLLASLKWHWKALIEGKVEQYATQVQALEDNVAKVVDSFAEQVAALVKVVGDTMLAAVGVTLGSFVAALFSDRFNSTIFRIGILAYAVYVVIFPLVYNMLVQWGRYQQIRTGFALQYQRFAQRLYHDKVDEIVGQQVDDSERRFRRWFSWTLAAYVVMVLVFILIAFAVPSIMPDGGLGVVPTPTGTLLPNPTIPVTPSSP